MYLCSLAADDVEEQVVTKTTKLVEKSASAAGLSVDMRFVSDIAVFVLKRDVKLQPINQPVVIREEWELETFQTATMTFKVTQGH